MTFGERLTELRTSAGYTKRNDFADKLGIPSTTLRNYETDVREPGHTFLKQISEFFNVSVDYLLGLTDEKEVLNSFRLKSSEYKYIEKYRDLDDHGKNIVTTILNIEYERIKNTPIAPGKEIINLIEYQAHKEATTLIPYWESGVSAGNGIYQLNDTSSVMMTLWATELTKQADFIIRVSGSSMEPDYHDGDKVLVNRKINVELGEVGIFVKNGDTYIKEMGNGELISRNHDYPNIPVHDFDNVVCLGKVIGILNDSMISKTQN